MSYIELPLNTISVQYLGIATELVNCISMFNPKLLIQLWNDKYFNKIEKRSNFWV